MAGLKSTEQAGVREDLSDLIVLADQRQCAAVSLIPKDSEPTNMLMEWQFDDYLEPNIQGHLSDEDRTNFENHSGRVRLKGWCQVFERAPKVGRIAEKINDVAGVGRKKEMAKCVAKALVVAKRDMECRILCADEGQEEDGETPYETRGLFVWADSSRQTDATTLVPEKALPPEDAIYKDAWANLTEATFREVILGAIWEETGTMEAFQMFCGRDLKSLVTGWSVYQPTVGSKTIVRTFNTDDEDMNVLRASVDMIEGDFGSIELTATPWLRRELDMSVDANKTTARRSGIIFDPEMLALRFNQMPGFRPFEDKGGGPRGLIEAIGGLISKNPKGMGVIDPQS